MVVKPEKKTPQKRLKVEKAAFDKVLGKLIASPPVPRKPKKKS